ncbi:hypothetical protein [Diplocloster hominis]|uniref:hypothetical protein n=1 Tax=Diplocloster hominis TaxID=3079010 RepID=UPI0031BA9BDE
MKKQIMMLAASLFIILGTVGLSGTTAKAAGFTITGETAPGPGEQVFTVSNYGEADNFSWSADGGFSGQFWLESGGSTRFSVPTDDYIVVQVSSAKNGSDFAVSRNEYPVAVYANYGGSKTQLTTLLFNMNQGSIDYTVDANVTVNGVTYTCTNGTTQYLYYGEGSSMEFIYEQVQQPDKYIDVYFTDTNGYMLGSDSFAVSYGSSVNYTAPAEYQANNRNYSAVSGQSMTVSHRYDSTRTSYSFTYAAQTAAPDKPYSVAIRLVDASSNEVFAAESMTIPAGGSNTFPVPGTYVAGTTSYRLAANQPASITHSADNAQRSYDVLYDVVSTKVEYQINIRFTDAVTGETLRTETITVPVDSVAAYDLPSTVEANGHKYLLASGQASRLTHDYNKTARNYTIYYNEVNNEQTASYNIGIQYVDVKTNAVLFRDTRQVNAGGSVNISAPASYQSAGNSYVMLAGQSGDVTHSYSNTRRNYIIYYRNVNDTENENTVVTEQVVNEIINEDGETVVIPSAVTTITNPAGTQTTVDQNGNLVTIPDEAVPLSDGTQPDTTAEQSAKTDENEKQDLVNIEDEPVPLAAGAPEQSSPNVLMITGISLAALALLGAAGILILKRRKKA